MIAPRKLFEGKPPRFREGQLVRHLRYGYRGVIVAFDRVCQASDAWYLANKTQPEREQPWYHVLVDGSTHATYAAESSLAEDDETDCIVHPWVNEYFEGFSGVRYQRNAKPWPFGAP